MSVMKMTNAMNSMTRLSAVLLGVSAFLVIQAKAEDIPPKIVLPQTSESAEQSGAAFGASVGAVVTKEGEVRPFSNSTGGKAKADAVQSKVGITAVGLSVRAPTEPLKERVRAAETVFVGKLINKAVEGDWVRAELLVEEPLVSSKRDSKIEVIWRATIGGTPIYDTDENSRGIAILKDKHEGRYWLRDDKFEDLNKLAEVKKILKAG